MNQKYMPQQIELKWQRYWEENDSFAATEDPSREKYYLLEMFPYPSGRIHMGHVRNYTIGDVVARYKRMQGLNVLHPMGWDAFGMPAENAAIEHGVHPAKWTRENIAYMRGQLKRMGFSYDWAREFATCDPSYYRWEQWLFLQMLEKGLVYRKKTFVNWCDSCATVLANEQVEQGDCWRCGKTVAQREQSGWFFKITDYADELLEFTDKLPGWPEKVLISQRNWVGKSYGAAVKFPHVGPHAAENDAIEVFTTRPDTLYGVTFMSLAPEHPLALALAKGTEHEAVVTAFVNKVKSEDKISRTMDDYEKEGVFTGAYVTNPLTGAEVPVYVANFVLMDYGTGAVMAVPAHDQRDFEFARKYDLPIQVVIQGEEPLDPATMTEAYVGEGVLVNSAQFNGTKNKQAIEDIAAYMDDMGIGGKTTNFRLRDWGVSRQRYWGAPIPVIHCDECGTVPVPEDQLPVTLPEDVEFPEGRVLPLANIPSYYETTCPKCGKDAKRETDTMDTFVESSWYYSRFACSDYDKGMFDRKRLDYWLPVDQYIGGIEHAVLHLLYSRFWVKVQRDLGLTSMDEPFTNLLTQGMVCKETMRCPEHEWLFPEEVEDGKCVKCGQPAAKGRVEKMSKSKKNVIDPEALIEAYGADTARLFSLFASPPELDLDWNEKGVEGSYRFLRRVWRMVADNADWLIDTTPYSEGKIEGRAKDIRRKTHDTIRRVTKDIETRFHFNTAVSAMMELVNELTSFKADSDTDRAVFREAVNALVTLLCPMVPHFSEELWEELGGEGQLLNAKWPDYDEAALAQDSMVVMVQINGKVRGKLEIPTGASQEDVEATAKADANVSKHLDGKKIVKVIYVPGKILNIVVR